VVYQDILNPPPANRVDAPKHLSVFDTELRSPALLIKPPVCFDHPLCFSGSTPRSTHAVQDILFRTHMCRTAVCGGVYVGAMRYRDVLFVPNFLITPTPVAIHPIQGILKPKLTELLQSFGRLRHRCSATKTFVPTTTTKNVLSRLLYCCLHRPGTTKIYELFDNQQHCRSQSKKGLTWMNLQKTCTTMH
jgi:hypothetical protein